MYEYEPRFMSSPKEIEGGASDAEDEFDPALNEDSKDRENPIC